MGPNGGGLVMTANLTRLPFPFKLRLTLLPGHTWIKAWYSVSSICMSFLYVHLPDGLRCVCLGNLQHTGTGDCRKRGGHIEFDIAVWQLVDASTPKRIGTREILPDNAGDSCV